MEMLLPSDRGLRRSQCCCGSYSSIKRILLWSRERLNRSAVSHTAARLTLRKTNSGVKAMKCPEHRIVFALLFSAFLLEGECVSFSADDLLK